MATGPISVDVAAPAFSESFGNIVLPKFGSDFLVNADPAAQLAAVSDVAGAPELGVSGGLITGLVLGVAGGLVALRGVG